MKNTLTRLEMYRAHFPEGGKGIEIGVQRGVNALDILHGCAPSLLVLVDQWGDDEVNQNNLKHTTANLGEFMRQGIVKTYRGKSAEVLPQLLEEYGQNFDFVYVDGDHTFEGCYSDLMLADKLVKPGGVIAGHDYADTRKNAWVRKQGWGVFEAVAEFAKNTRWKAGRAFDHPEHLILPSFILRETW